MDIQSNLNKPISNANLNRSYLSEDKANFQQIVAKEARKETAGHLNELLGAIDIHGKKLGQNQSIDNLKRYKKHVKEFMNYVKNNAIKLDNREEFNGFGHSKTLSIVRKVDEKLIELTDQILQKEGDSGLRVLNLIGEVKGLLVDVFV